MNQPAISQGYRDTMAKPPVMAEQNCTVCIDSYSPLGAVFQPKQE
jgi:hypothetical protein